MSAFAFIKLEFLLYHLLPEVQQHNFQDLIYLTQDYVFYRFNINLISISDFLKQIF